ncbi:MAG: TetR/AcrR family transcriptional regulator, partial [Solirubrobacteraceae bacterium]
PLRRDAERNRQRILEAARELFAQRGLAVTLNDVAHHAGVGVGTVYRRFPDKTHLIDDLFEQRLADLAALMEEALGEPDPLRGLTHFLERSVAMQAADRGLKDLMTGMPDGLERVCRIRDALLPKAALLVARAQAGGTLRDDISPEDLPVLQLMLGALIDSSHDVSPELWRRYLALLLRGMGSELGGPRQLPVEPLEPSQVGAVMSHRKSPRR